MDWQEIYYKKLNAKFNGGTGYFWSVIAWWLHWWMSSQGLTVFAAWTANKIGNSPSLPIYTLAIVRPDLASPCTTLTTFQVDLTNYICKNDGSKSNFRWKCCFYCIYLWLRYISSKDLLFLESTDSLVMCQVTLLSCWRNGTMLYPLTILKQRAFEENLRYLWFPFMVKIFSTEHTWKLIT